MTIYRIFCSISFSFKKNVFFKTPLYNLYLILFLLFFFLQSCSPFSSSTSTKNLTFFFSFPNKNISKTYLISDSVENGEILDSKTFTISYSKKNNLYTHNINNQLDSGFFSSSPVFLELENINLTPFFILENNQVKGLSHIPGIDLLIPNNLDITFEINNLEIIQITHKHIKQTVIPIQFDFYSQNTLIMQYTLYSAANGILKATQKLQPLLSYNPVDSSFIKKLLLRTYTLQ